MRAEKKTALIVVDMLKGLTTEGGYNYYPTAGKMMEEGFSEKIEKMRERGALIIYICGSGKTRTGFTASPHSINPELAGRDLSAIPYDESWGEFDDRLHIAEGDLIVRKHTYSVLGNAFTSDPPAKRRGERAGVRHQDKCVLPSDSHRFRQPRLQDLCCERYDLHK